MRLALFLFFGLDYFAAFVVTAVGANGMRQPFFAAVAARDQVAGLQRIMCTAAITASLAVFPFWMWWHGLTPNLLDEKGLERPHLTIATERLPGGRLKDYTGSTPPCQGCLELFSEVERAGSGKARKTQVGGRW
jgi:hypothetical protein